MKISGKKEKNVVLILTLVFFVILSLFAFFLQGTADSGDSIYHFLFAKYVFRHPVNFLDLWAKPVYVLLGAPFAQFGFVGIKIFNVFNSTLTLIATLLIADKLKLRNRWLLPIIMLLAPLNVIVTLSGLTEPLFACILSWSIYLTLTSKRNYGLILFSFLPFVRSEGFFLIVVIALYLFWIGNWHKILYLVTGTVVYSFIGSFHFRDILWVFHDNPYSLKSQYGTGPWYWFFAKMPSILGLPLTILLVIGLIYAVIIVFKHLRLKEKHGDSTEIRLLLILALFLTYFTFHVVAWTFGLFSSYGELRVIIGIIPLIALIILIGYNSITAVASKTNPIIHAAFVPVIIFCTCINIPNLVYVREWQWPLKLYADQRCARDLALFMRQNYPDYKRHVFFYSATYLSVALNQDWFDESVHRGATGVDNSTDVPSGSFIIWDDWFARTESLLPLERLINNSRFQMIKTFSEPDMWGNPVRMVLFIKK